MPPLRIVELSPDGGPGPYGAKAGGEFNIAAVAPAIGNAIAAACGVRLDALPFTAERIYEGLQPRYRRNAGTSMSSMFTGATLSNSIASPG